MLGENEIYMLELGFFNPDMPDPDLPEFPELPLPEKKLRYSLLPTSDLAAKYIMLDTSCLEVSTQMGSWHGPIVMH